MKILLDTHVIIWVLTDDKRLKKAVKKEILNESNIIYFSTASLWEIAIKNCKAPSKCPYNEKIIYEKCIETGLEPLEISRDHIFNVRNLKIKKGRELTNMDPFDRILISQAKTENMQLLSADINFDNYDENCIYKI